MCERGCEELPSVAPRNGSGGHMTRVDLPLKPVLKPLDWEVNRKGDCGGDVVTAKSIP